MASMMTYAEARDALVTQLRQDAAAHETEQYDAVGRRFDALEHRFPRGTAPELGRLHIALTFWDGWAHARDHGWPPGPVAASECSPLPRAVGAAPAARGASGDEPVLGDSDLVSNPRVTQHEA